MKESENMDKYLDLAGELKKLLNLRVTVIPIAVGALETGTTWLEKYTEGLNYYEQKIRRTLARDIRKHWVAVSTLLGLISTVYRDLFHWISNQRP